MAQALERTSVVWRKRRQDRDSKRRKILSRDVQDEVVVGEDHSPGSSASNLPENDMTPVSVRPFESVFIGKERPQSQSQMATNDDDDTGEVHSPGSSASDLAENDMTSVSSPMVTNDDLSISGSRDLSLSIAERREHRTITLPARFQNISPVPLKKVAPPSNGPETIPPPSSTTTSSPNAVTTSTGNDSQENTTSVASQVQSDCSAVLRSMKNVFGLFREYSSSPSHDPDGGLSILELHDVPLKSANTGPPPNNTATPLTYAPYPNRSSFLLGEWFWSGKSKTLSDFRSLLKIMKAPEFSLDEIRDTRWAEMNEIMGSSSPTITLSAKRTIQMETLFPEDAGWRSEGVWISVPFLKGVADAQEYHVGDFYRRSIVSILKERLSAEDSGLFHLDPYKMFWQTDTGGPSQCVYTELYTSSQFLQEHEKVQALPRPAEPECNLQRVVAGLVFAIDETHLTQFGNTTLYPVYMYFANHSKYLQSRPGKKLCNHIAYFIKLPNNFKDYYKLHNRGKLPGQNVVPHCLRETIHAQWRSILDDEFLDAYQHGVVLRCAFDGKERRFYPRILVISADYPEKAMLTGIRVMGDHPCPQCLIPKTQVPNMGMARDNWWRRKRARSESKEYRQATQLAHDAIYTGGYAVKSDKVEDQLKDMSLTPSQNAFSQRLSHLGFNIFDAVPIDLMHEIESGTWEALFLHLLRILESAGGHLLDELDSRSVDLKMSPHLLYEFSKPQRYRATPTFGRETIRKFRRKISGLGHMATREWEDLLQCAIPAFDGLLEGPNNDRILQLLFIFASWHGIAKLRMHTEDTLELLNKLTVTLGQAMRDFRTKVCPAYATKELGKETQARNRRVQSAKAKREAVKGKSTSFGKNPKPAKKAPTDSHDREPQQAKPTSFSLSTYKFHAMGDYVDCIRKFGTIDSYSTETGELEHRTPKARYSRTSKKDFVMQITQIERRQARLQRIRQSWGNPQNNEPVESSSQETEELLQKGYILGSSESEYIHLGQFLQQNAGDPAIKDFNLNLKEHILRRALQLGLVGRDFQGRQIETSLFFQKDRLYIHRTLRVNYTTYDVRREQDLINPDTAGCNIMLHAISGSTHPFLYARVLKIFHVKVVFAEGDPTPHRFDCLWVRWYRMHQHPANSAVTLHKIKIASATALEAYGFIDPVNVVRSCHIIPAFSKGMLFSDESFATSRLARDGTDWREYYVGQFADRDLLMRYHSGMGVGHSVNLPPNTEGYGQLPKLLQLGAEGSSTSQGLSHSQLALMEVEEAHSSEINAENDLLGACPDEDSDISASDASDDDLNDDEFSDRHMYYHL